VSPASRDALLERVDPELRELALQVTASYAPFTPITLEKLAARRALITAAIAATPLDPSVARRSVPVGRGAPDVEVLLINARPGPARPIIVHTHGGGFTISSAAGSVPSLQAIARALDCVIVTIDFRNAPEARWDASLAETYAALLWTHRHAAELGGDPARIALLGESGGGGHAALLALTARDRGEVPIVFQALIYPMLDDRTGGTHPLPAHLGAFGWNAEFNQFGWRCFLGVEPGTAAVPAKAVPARYADLSGLPPTYIAAAALDLLALEDVEYARRLVEAGVPTELHLVPAAIHGFDLLAPHAAVSRRFTAAKIEALRQGLGI
jgi:acetyl esterase/lipase